MGFEHSLCSMWHQGCICNMRLLGKDLRLAHVHCMKHILQKGTRMAIGICYMFENSAI